MYATMTIQGDSFSDVGIPIEDTLTDYDSAVFGGDRFSDVGFPSQ
jgi:hypothetical protein